MVNVIKASQTSQTIKAS